VLLLLLSLGYWTLPSNALAATVPSGFDDSLVAVVARPTGLAFTPDGRMLIVTRIGPVRIYEGGTLLPTPAIDLASRLCIDNERGLLGVAVDPGFASNHYIYVYYTFKKYGGCDRNTTTSPVNRVSRFTLGDNDSIDPASELVLIDNIPSPDGVHNAGDLHFGRDGYLYVSVGDGGCDWRGNSGCYLLNDAARDLGLLSGKILRITATGGIPPGNPFTGSTSDRCNVTGSTSANRKCQEIFAYGLRNPFRLAFDPGATDTQFYINDVGQDVWEEVNASASGADYGWNAREGPCAINSRTNCGAPPHGMTNPIYAYDHNSGCTAVTVGAFIPTGIWPSQYDGKYLYGDLVCGKFFTLDPASGVASEFATGISNPISAVVGPYGATQALYYISWPQYPNDEIRRIAYTGAANRAPTASIAAQPTSGALPLAVQFDGRSSSDPDGDPLSYDWDFGDGSAHASGSTATHTYTVAGTYTARLTVSDDRQGQDSTTVRIDAGNDPPQPVITSPDVDELFSVGESLLLTGGASDPQDGTLPDSSLSWRVERHHATHTHPFLAPTIGNSIPITGPPPEDIYATTNSYLEVDLTATDSRGLTATVSRNVYPQTVDVTFATDPTGLSVEVAGASITGPTTITGWDGWSLPVNVPDQADGAGTQYEFASWSDGGARTHSIALTQQPTTFTAVLRSPYDHPVSASSLRLSLVPAFRQTVSDSSCTASGRLVSTHGSPLSLRSCQPPAYRPGVQARLGPKSVASAQLDAVAGPGGETSDVGFTLNATDVEDRASGVDYQPNGSGPDVTLLQRVRLTDRDNGTYPGTTIDFELPVPVDCASTPDPSTGSTCSVSVTESGLLPGAFRAGLRAVLQVHRLRLDDAGANGVTSDADDGNFAQQGIYVR
jgi:glucose/arabinose dehydrogenase/PKD repeat protein